MITKRRFLFEADDDNTSAANSNANDSAESNDTAATDNNNAESNESEDNSTEEKNDTEQNSQDENKDENKEEENKEEEKDPDDFSDDDFTIGDGDNVDDDKEESSDSSSGGEEDEHKVDPDSLKAKDRELFDTLSIEEQQIKIKELKKQFGDLYSDCVSLVDRINEISTELSSGQINKITKIILELKSSVSFYVLNLYDIKSFIENDVMFNQYLSILDRVKNVLETIKNEEFSDK